MMTTPKGYTPRARVRMCDAHRYLRARGESDGWARYRTLSNGLMEFRQRPSPKSMLNRMRKKATWHQRHEERWRGEAWRLIIRYSFFIFLFFCGLGEQDFVPTPRTITTSSLPVLMSNDAEILHTLPHPLTDTDASEQNNRGLSSRWYTKMISTTCIPLLPLLLSNVSSTRGLQQS